MTEITLHQAPAKKNTGFRNLMILIVIGLLVWQYALPMFMDITTPGDYLNNFLNPELPDDLVFYPIIINQVTGTKTIMPRPSDFPEYEKTNYQMGEYEFYKVGIECNLPARYFSHYNWNIKLSVDNLTSGGVDTYPFIIRIAGYQPAFTSVWFLPEEDVFINYERNYIFQFALMDADGNGIKAFTLVPGLEVYSATFFMLAYSSP